VSVYNDESDKIRVTELSASVNYYYTDGTVYVQKFFSLKLYVKSTYKQSYESSQEEPANTEDQLQTTQDDLANTENQLEEQQLLTGNLNSMVIMFVTTTLVFATVAAFLGFYMLSKRARAIQQQS
jgi:Flp pilus assembly protein TadB